MTEGDAAARREGGDPKEHKGRPHQTIPYPYLAVSGDSKETQRKNKSYYTYLTWLLVPTREAPQRNTKEEQAPPFLPLLGCVRMEATQRNTKEEQTATPNLTLLLVPMKEAPQRNTKEEQTSLYLILT